MERRRLGNLDVSPSLLGMGCMRLPLNDDGTVNESLGGEMVKAAIGGGINYFDTSYVYNDGQSEKFIGRALSDYPRKSFYIATKLPPWKVTLAKDAERIFNEQLSRLRMNYIDFYLIQALDRKRWADMLRLKIPEWCEGLKKAGKIRYFGFSFHDTFDGFKEIIGAREWDFCQIQLNYTDTGTEQGGLPAYELCEKKGVPLIVMEPVKGGSLSKLPSDLNGFFTDINPMASISSWAMRWVIGLPGVKIILSGMNSMEQIRDNLSTFNNYVPLSEREKAAIEAVKSARAKRSNNGCTYCGYCEPCPKGVKISRVFRIWNDYAVYENFDVTKWEWLYGTQQSERPDCCVGCGDCARKCSQKINTVDDLKRAQKELDDLCK
ncbi:MAG: aldo/keto reductase [Oscillospiraceae bacterium]|jgi:predicted aldo/keto reductase-like oxidoreductase|nr:aldo/keto reductase [Oscillospiraceae bacterium]